jgi:hypothetical protein
VLTNYSEADKGHVVEIYLANGVFIICVIFVIFILCQTVFVSDVYLNHTGAWNECITLKKGMENLVPLSLVE